MRTTWNSARRTANWTAGMTEAFWCDECGAGVILWDGYREETFDGYDDFYNVTSVEGIEIGPNGFCYDCHLRVN
jgi:hypothetical protein